MEKCNDFFEREFYIKMTKKYGWTKDVLINHIENKTYEKYLLNQTNFETNSGLKSPTFNSIATKLFKLL